MLPRRVAILVLCFLPAAGAAAQIPDSLFDGIARREIGPAVMSGRITDLAVLEDDPDIFYAASASGGLLKTINGGGSWENVFDSQTTVSIGDVAINPADPTIVWVGTGEANNRQSSSWGDGVHKSSDGGKTWRNMGLRESQHIGRIVIDPQDTDVVYVAAVGRLWGLCARDRYVAVGPCRSDSPNVHRHRRAHNRDGAPTGPGDATSGEEIVRGTAARSGGVRRRAGARTSERNARAHQGAPACRSDYLC